MKILTLLGLLTLGGLAVAVASAQTPILQYTFNETGTTAASTGANPTPMTFVNASGAAVDLHSADGLGVSGSSGDRAFDNTASTGMGKGSTGGAGIIPPNTLGTLSSFTFQCWFKVSTPVGNLARLLEDNRISLECGDAGDLVLFVNGNATSSAPAYSGTGEWIFMAVSYDSGLSSNNVVFYEGTENTPVTQVGAVLTLNGGVLNQDHALAVGNYFTAGVRPLDGYMDDVRIYGNPTNSSGALNLAQLEAIRERDLRNGVDVLGRDAVSIGGSIIQETGNTGKTSTKPISIANVISALGITNAPAANTLRYYYDRSTQSYVIAPRSDALTGLGQPIVTVLSMGGNGVSWNPGSQSSIAAYGASGLNGYLSGTGLLNGIFLGGVETDTTNATLFGTVSDLPAIMKCTVTDIFNDGSALGALQEPGEGARGFQGHHYPRQ